MGIIRPGAPSPVGLGGPGAQSLLHGGGTRTVTLVGGGDMSVSWNFRIIWIASGRSPTTALNGYFQIDMPPDGTTITGHGGRGNQTVTGGKIVLNYWDALYYELPLGGSSGSNNTNFHIAYYTSDFDLPSSWVMIAKGNSDTPHTVHWFDGVEDTGWRPMSLLNGWTNYGGGYRVGSYRRLNRVVHLDGLLYDPGGNPSAIQIATLAAGFTPSYALWGTGNHSDAGGQFYVTTSGGLYFYNDGTDPPYVGLSGFSFPVD